MKSYQLPMRVMVKGALKVDQESCTGVFIYDGLPLSKHKKGIVELVEDRRLSVIKVYQM